MGSESNGPIWQKGKVMGSLLRVWEVEDPSLNLVMGTAWEIISCSWLMLTSVFDGDGCTAMAHSDFLLPQARV